MNKYKEVELYFKNQIIGGNLKPGYKFPSVAEMCEKFQVSHITIQKAFTNLLNDGYIERVKGTGTFVRDSDSQNTHYKKTLGLVVSNVQTDSSAVSIITGVQTAATEKGFDFLLKITNSTFEQETEAIDYFAEKGVDGLLLNINNTEQIYFYMRQEKTWKIPYIMLDHYDATKPCNSVSPNNIDGGYLATEYLLNRGHKKIAFLGERQINTEKDRYSGYINAHKVYNVAYDLELSFLSHEDLQKRFLSKLIETRATAVFAVNDKSAVLAMQYLLDNGFRIPEDISIIGFDDFEAAKYATIPLTTIKQDFLDLGKNAVNLMEEIFKDGFSNYKKIFLPIMVVERKSVIDISNI